MRSTLPLGWFLNNLTISLIFYDWFNLLDIPSLLSVGVFQEIFNFSIFSSIVITNVTHDYVD